MRQRVDSVLRRIERRLDRAGESFVLLPQIDFERTRNRRAIGGEKNLHARPIRVRRVRPGDDGGLPAVEADEVAGRIDANQLHESSYQILVKLLAVVPLQDREDAIRWKR